MLEYQGTRYRGWQVQKNARTVQGELMHAAREVFGAPVDVQGAGRTDAGVHALGQVAHLEAPPFAGGDLSASLNDLLPKDIVVVAARRVEGPFHARHDAVGRSYLYQVARRRTAFGKSLTWWVRDPLDSGAMREAALGLTGMHDFAAFADKGAKTGTSTLVLIEEATVGDSGELILVRFRASHFLWKMVRRLVGCLVEVGRGALSPGEFGGLLEGGGDYAARHTAPPSGLFLEEVLYPGGTWRRPLEPVLNVARP